MGESSAASAPALTGRGKRRRFDHARAALTVAYLERLGRDKPALSVLYVGRDTGGVLSELLRRFPRARCFEVDWPTHGRVDVGSAGSEAIERFPVDLDQLFRSRPRDKQVRFDVVILGYGFAAPLGSGSSLTPQWVDGFLDFLAARAIGVATRDRMRDLRERGRVVPLESWLRPGRLVCCTWTPKRPSRARRVLGVALGPYASPVCWFFENLRWYGIGDAWYYARATVRAVSQGVLPRTALTDDRIRAGYCATLVRPARVHPNRVYAFVFLGEFGYEVMNWQGVVRKFSRLIPASSRIVIGGRPGLQLFYETASQYIDISTVPEFRQSHAASYFAMSPAEVKRHRPPTLRQHRYDTELRRAIERRMRDALPTEDGRRIEFIFSSRSTALGGLAFGADPRFYRLPGYHGRIYADLDLANNEYAMIPTDTTTRDRVEAALGFGLDEPYVFVQSRRRSIGPQRGGVLDVGAVLERLAQECRVIDFSFRSGRHLDSGSTEFVRGAARYEAETFLEQSCLIGHALNCVLLTEGDLGTHTYLPPLMGKDAVVIAARSVLASRNAPLEFWNEHVFRFGGQLIPVVADRLISPSAADDVVARVLSGDSAGLVAVYGPEAAMASPRGGFRGDRSAVKSSRSCHSTRPAE